MNLFGLSFYLGRFWGINVRVHWTLFLFMIFRIVYMLPKLEAWGLGKLSVGIAVTICLGIFLSILLHEFGHSLTCRFFKGDANEILMWPLGGLAFCRPPHHPIAHLMTTVNGPLVTLALWLLFGFGASICPPGFWNVALGWLSQINLFLLLFNLLPGFPMDGGRLIRDILWNFIGYTKATIFAVWCGRVTGIIMILAGMGLLDQVDFLSSVLSRGNMLTIIGLMVFLSNMNVEEVLAREGAGDSDYSIKDHMKHAKRRSNFNKAMKNAENALHECKTCERTEFSDPELEFRVGEDGEEYCVEHLPS